MFDPQSVPYMLMLIVLAGVAAALAVFGIRRRFAPGAIAFAILMLSVTQWASGYALEIGARSLAAKIFWARWEYFGIVTIPVAWVIFALQVRARMERNVVQLTLLLKIVPLITVLVVWTNDLHGLLWRSATLDRSGPFAALNVTYGPYFWVHMIYTQILLVYGTAVLASLLRAQRLYRRQVGALLFGIVAPWVANALYIFKASPIPNLDLTPFAFTATGTAFAWSLFRLRFLDVVPIAYDAIIGALRDGVIVLDQLERIVDLNPVGASMIGRESADVIGRRATQVLPAGLLDALAHPGPEGMRVALVRDAASRTYDVKNTRISDRRGKPAGQVLVIRDVTARQQTEDALRASEERYRVVSELTSDYAFSLRLEGEGRLGVDWVTDAFNRITGMTTEEVQARGGWLSLVHPGDKAAALDNALQLVAGKSTVTEFRIVNLAGETRWIRTYSQPIWDAHEGRVTRLLGAGQDVTERRMAELALAESEHRYRSLFDSSPNPMWLHDEETGAFLAVNDAAVAHYGYDRTTFLQMRVDELRPAEDRLTVQRGGMQGEPARHSVVRHRKRDGTLIMVDLAAQPVTLGERQARIVVSTDITARLAAEAALRQQNEYLAALHETTLALINRLEVEDVLQAIVVRAGQLVGTRHGYMYLVEPETGDLVVQIGVGHFQGRRGYRIRSDEAQGVAGVVRDTGQPFAVADYQSWAGHRPDLVGEPFRATVGTPLTSGGEVIGVLGLSYVEPGRTFTPDAIEILTRFAQLASIALDNARLFTTAQQELAERKRAEADLALARDEALEAARLKAGFLAAMSHELRTPLNAIIGFTDLTLEERGGALNAVQRSNLQRVSRNAHSLLELIDSILDMSKIDAGRMQLSVERVFLDQIVLGAVANVETLVAAKQLTLNVRRSQRFTPVVFGDSMRLHQIVINLLSNAVKFTPPGGDIAVILEWDGVAAIEEAATPSSGRPAGEWVALSVRDSGIGIPPEEHERVWSEFYQVDHGTTRQFGGTGLGLAIVKRLSLLMNGQVGVASEPERGSTFSVWLPAHAQDAQPPNGHAQLLEPYFGEETLKW